MGSVRLNSTIDGELVKLLIQQNHDMNNTINKLQESIQTVSQNTDMFFLITMSLIIYFMQCGFAFLECGAVRSKNTTNILLKNVLDSFVGCLAYWLIGYPLAYGQGNVFLGTTYWAHHDMPSELMSGWFFQFVFAATASTIVSGAMAERCDFVAYLVYSFVITGFLYPVVTHWAWDSQGWLSQGAEYTFCALNNGTAECTTETIGFVDFAGSAVVHCCGGIAALVGAFILGSRIGRFQEDGTPVAIKGHSVPLTAMGGFILFFGFFAFNGGSQGEITGAGSGSAVATACVNTIVSGSFAAFTCLLSHYTYSRIRYNDHHWSLLTTINGGLAGMVAICAGCDGVYTWGAMVIGIVAGFSFLFWSWLVLKLRIDDPLDAVAVHFGAGAWGVLAAPIFRRETGVVFNWDQAAFLRLGWNAAGLVAIAGWSMVVSTVIFLLLRLLRMLRVDEEIERKGLDIPKHGEPAYPKEAYGHGWNQDSIDDYLRRSSRFSISRPVKRSSKRISIRSNGDLEEMQETTEESVKPNVDQEEFIEPTMNGLEEQPKINGFHSEPAYYNKSYDGNL